MFIENVDIFFPLCIMKKKETNNTSFQTHELIMNTA